MTYFIDGLYAMNGLGKMVAHHLIAASLGASFFLLFSDVAF